MIYHVHADTDPTPRQIYASSSKWAARKWARKHCVYKTTVHVRAQNGMTTSWSVAPKLVRTWRVQVAP